MSMWNDLTGRSEAILNMYVFKNRITVTLLLSAGHLL